MVSRCVITLLLCLSAVCWMIQAAVQDSSIRSCDVEMEGEACSSTVSPPQPESESSRNNANKNMLKDLVGLLDTVMNQQKKTTDDQDLSGSASVIQTVLQKMTQGKQNNKVFSKILQLVTKLQQMDDDNDTVMEDLLEHLMELVTPDHAMGDSPIELETLLHQNATRVIQQQLAQLIGQDDIANFHPLQFYYYMLDQEQRQNSVWKRHEHRFLPTLPLDRALELADALYLSQLAYAQDCSVIESALTSFQNGIWQLRNCSLHARPFEPAHFLAAGPESSAILVIRGSRQVADIVSASNIHTVEYHGGQAHAGLVTSAQWLYAQYQSQLQDYKQLFLMGHSLGGGIAALTAMEFSSTVPAYAIGFGSPASLSVQLAESVQDFVTTVVLDDDVVPRLSAANLVQAWRDLLQYNFTTACLDDVHQLAGLVHEQMQPWLGKNLTQNLVQGLQDQLEDHIRRQANQQLAKAFHSTVKPTPMMAPGECVHLYRDGTRWQAVSMPCRRLQLSVVQHMLSDHLIPSGYYPGLLAYLRQAHNDHDWRFPHDLDSLL